MAQNTSLVESNWKPPVIKTENPPVLEESYNYIWYSKLFLLDRIFCNVPVDSEDSHQLHGARISLDHNYCSPFSLQESSNSTTVGAATVNNEVTELVNKQENISNADDPLENGAKMSLEETIKHTMFCKRQKHINSPFVCNICNEPLSPLKRHILNHSKNANYDTHLQAFKQEPSEPAATEGNISTVNGPLETSDKISLEKTSEHSISGNPRSPTKSSFICNEPLSSKWSLKTHILNRCKNANYGSHPQTVKLEPSELVSLKGNISIVNDPLESPDKISPEKTIEHSIPGNRQSSTKSSFVCDICNKTLSTKYTLKMHVLNHSKNVKPNKCDMLPQTLKLESHELIVKEGNVATSEDPSETLDKMSLEKTVRNSITGNCWPTTKSSFVCDICNKTLSTKYNLKKHVLSHSENIKSYKCGACPQAFKLESSLQIHSLIHTKDKSYQCDICDKSFSRKVYLQSHSKIHIKPKSFKCIFCNKCFRYKTSLQVHHRIHTGEKPFSCEVCNKSFSNKIYLNTHYLTHGEKSYECEVCKKCFTQKSSLNLHARQHTGIKPFSCKLCGKRFLHKFYLKTHYVTHTGIKNYKCDLCNKTFTQKSGLNVHLASHKK